MDDVSAILSVTKNKVLTKKNMESSILRWAKLSKLKKKSAVEDFKKCLTSEVKSVSKKFRQEFNRAHQTPQFESTFEFTCNNSVTDF